MEKGTGKTLTALEVIRLAKPKTVLIVTNTKASVENWYRQIMKFVVSDDPTDRFGIRTIVMGYSTCVHIRIYNPYRYDVTKPDMIILDESHCIKNRKSKRYKVLNRLRKLNPQARRIIMTATPTSLNQTDLWAQYVFLGVFSDRWKSFEHEYCEKYGFMNKKVRIREDKEVEFMAMVDEASVYVGEEVLNLKPHQDNIIRIKQKPINNLIYSRLKEEFILQIQDVKTVTPNVLSKMIKLHQICGGSVITEYGVKLLTPCEKLDWVMSYLASTDKKVVIFCAYNNEISRLHLLLTDLHIKHELLYKGSRERGMKAIEEASWIRFQEDPEIKAIVCQFKSGSQGIDLHAADTVIYYSLNFNYIDFNQSLGRIRRRGQTSPTTAIYLIIDGTIDRLIYDNLNKKEKIAQAVFEQLKKNRY